LDLDDSINVPLNQIIEKDKDFIFLYETDRTRLCNRVMFIKEKHILMENTIKEMVNRIHNGIEFILLATGPLLINDIYYTLLTGSKCFNIIDNNNINLNYLFLEYYKNQYNGILLNYDEEKKYNFSLRIFNYNTSMLYYDEERYIDSIYDYNKIENKQIHQKKNINSITDIQKYLNYNLFNILLQKEIYYKYKFSIESIFNKIKNECNNKETKRFKNYIENEFNNIEKESIELIKENNEITEMINDKILEINKVKFKLKSSSSQEIGLNPKILRKLTFANSNESHCC
jgi:hypothetical protein